METLSGSNYESINPDDLDGLRYLLSSHGFDLAHWGDGSTKPVEALWDEITEGETELVNRMGIMMRRTKVVAVDVYAILPRGSFRLAETKQVYKNGSVRERNLFSSLGEKIKRDEPVEQAVERAVAEELGITTVKSLELCGAKTIERRSDAFDGMLTDLLVSLARVEINEADFKSEGYVEVQKDKSIHFDWHEI